MWRHYIAGGTGPVAVYTRKSNGTNEIHYLTRDHLGSVDSVSNAAGAVEVRMAYGAFGQRRQESGWSGNLTSADWTGVASTTRRGYTFHETLDNLNLTHMNGRVYDQVTGRFLSPDPLVQAPGFTQSFNRYAYVFNNPLSYIDPSGYETKSADGDDGAADTAGAFVIGGPYGALAQLVRLWMGYGETPGEEIRRKSLAEVVQQVPQFDSVQVPRTANTDAGEPVRNDPAAGFTKAVAGERCVFTAGMATCGAEPISREFQWGFADVLIGTAGFAFDWNGAEFRQYVFHVPSVDPNSKDYKDGFATGVIVTFGLGRFAAGRAGASAAAMERPPTMYHYTTAEGMEGIVSSVRLNPSLRSLNPRDVRYGEGQYLSDIQPGTMTLAQFSRWFLGQPFQGRRFTNYVEIDVSGLEVAQGRPGVFVIPNNAPLDLTGRIIGYGVNSP